MSVAQRPPRLHRPAAAPARGEARKPSEAALRHQLAKPGRQLERAVFTSGPSPPRGTCFVRQNSRQVPRGPTGPVAGPRLPGPAGPWRPRPGIRVACRARQVTLAVSGHPGRRARPTRSRLPGPAVLLPRPSRVQREARVPGPLPQRAWARDPLTPSAAPREALAGLGLTRSRTRATPTERGLGKRPPHAAGARPLCEGQSADSRMLVGSGPHSHSGPGQETPSPGLGKRPPGHHDP
jgi:hypothetical protein